MLLTIKLSNHLLADDFLPDFQMSFPDFSIKLSNISQMSALLIPQVPPCSSHISSIVSPCSLKYLRLSFRFLLDLSVLLCFSPADPDDDRDDFCLSLSSHWFPMFLYCFTLSSLLSSLISHVSSLLILMIIVIKST